MERTIKTWVIAGVLLGTMAYAIAEEITLTTYYPAPRGVYKELRTTDNTYLATQAGNVGIGTTSPARKLTVHGGAADPVIQLTDNTTGTAIDDGGILRMIGSELSLGNGEQAGLSLYVDNDALKGLYIKSGSGFVGIGTTTPLTGLHMKAAPSVGTSFGGIFIEADSGPTITPGLLFLQSDRTEAAGLAASQGGFSIDASAGDAVLRVNTGGLVFATAASSPLHPSAGPTCPVAFADPANPYPYPQCDYPAKMKLTNAGSLGIGTMAPAALLHVDGGTTIPNLARFGGTSLDFIQIESHGTARGTIRYDQDILQFWSGSSGEVMRMTSAGRVGIGAAPVGSATLYVKQRASDTNALYVDGKQYINGDLTISGKIYGADVAESIGCEDCAAGEVVVIDPDHDQRVKRSSAAYAPAVAGVISEKPALHVAGRQEDEPPSELVKPLALVGQVKCRATTEGGPIRRGDLLVTASKPGYAMRADLDKVKPGMTVGKALQPLEQGEGLIVVLITGQ